MEVWSDVQGLGGEVAMRLHELPEDSFERSDLLMKLRIMVDERENSRRQEEETRTAEGA